MAFFVEKLCNFQFDTYFSLFYLFLNFRAFFISKKTYFIFFNSFSRHDLKLFNGTMKKCQCLQNNHILVMELVVSCSLDLKDDIYPFLYTLMTISLVFWKRGTMCPPSVLRSPKKPGFNRVKNPQSLRTSRSSHRDLIDEHGYGISSCIYNQINQIRIEIPLVYWELYIYL